MKLRPLVLSLFLALSTTAQAEVLDSSVMLKQFNLVVLNNDQSYSHVDGRTFIGGNVSGGDYVQRAGDTPASDFAGLSVMGAANGLHVNGLGGVFWGALTNSTVNAGNSVALGGVGNVNFNGPAYVEGAVYSTNFNGGRLFALNNVMQTNIEASAISDFNSVMRSLSTSLALTPSTGSTVSFNGYGKATFNAVPDASGVAVFDLANVEATLFSQNEFEFNLNGATTVIMNSGVPSATIWANFLGGSAQTVGAKVIWNFYAATDLVIYSQFGGAVLAPNANLTNYNNIEGGVFVNSLTQYGEIHLQPFSGVVVGDIPQ